MYRPLPAHLPALDGLRGVAALIVVVSHGANAGWLPLFLGQGFGQTGVSLFYGLSGFLMMHFVIGRPLNAANLRRYAVARAARVLPLFYLALAVASAIFVLSGTGFYGLSGPATLTGNWLILHGTGVLWSVPVEIHFYLLFPLLWWALARGWFPATAIMLLAGSAVLGWLMPQVKPDTFLPYWLHFFVIGAGLRWLLDDGTRNRLGSNLPGRWATGAAWAAFAALVLLPPQVRIGLGQPAIPARLDPAAIVAVPLLLWLCCTLAGPFGLLARGVLRWFGAISFALYLVHSPVLEVVRTLARPTGLGGAAQFAIMFAISVVLAAGVTRWFDLPVRTALRRRYDNPSIAAQQSAPSC